MARKTTLLLASAALLGLSFGAPVAWSDPGVTQQTTTTTTIQPPAGVPGATATTITKETTVVTPPPPTETITTKTVTAPLPATPGTRTINFMDFDLNHDGVLSTREAGDMLFKLYDLDGNEVIDNKEYEKKTVLTVVPMAKETTVRYDFGDGGSSQVEHTYDSFLQRTQLSRFTHNSDGLSPHDFAGKSFNEMDVNHDGVIDLKEWQGGYDAALDKQNKLDAQLNK